VIDQIQAILDAYPNLSTDYPSIFNTITEYKTTFTTSLATYKTKREVYQAEYNGNCVTTTTITGATTTTAVARTTISTELETVSTTEPSPKRQSSTLYILTTISTGKLVTVHPKPLVKRAHIDQSEVALTKLEREPEEELATTKLNALHEVTIPTTKLNTQPQIELTTTTLPEVALTMTKYNSTHEETNWIEIEERKRKNSHKARSCPACSLTIMNLSWCIKDVPNKHYLDSSKVACCYHPYVIARNTDGMKCKCCKLGVAEHCRKSKPNCYKK
jgi:hypothetical protein